MPAQHSDGSEPLRHPAVQELLRWFDSAHLVDDDVRHVAQIVALAARNMVLHVNDGPELSAGLRKLLEAKDCFVRQAIADKRAERLSASQGDQQPDPGRPGVPKQR